VRVRALVVREEGQAMMLVVFLVAMVTVLAVSLIDIVTSETTRSAHSEFSNASFQAAEAGIDDYTAKLLDDHLYYLHYVHDAESTRHPASGSDVAAGNPWTGGLTWTYPNGRDNWVQLPNGYEYNLQITGPTSTVQTVDIVATGRKTGSATDERSVETLIRPSSVADYQMLADADISYGSTATTYGKIYSSGDVNHQGTAYANVYAEGRVSGGPCSPGDCNVYDSATTPGIRTQIKTPVNFNNFLTSLSDIKRASQIVGTGGGVYLNSVTSDAWKLVFASNGTFTAQTCTKTSGNDVAKTAPTCGSATTYNVPTNGAIYVEQSAVVSGQVNGRVTVASNNNIVIGGDISYVQSGDDVLGLVAKNNMIVAYYTSTGTLNWRAATIAQSGQWTDYCGYGGSGCGSHGTMNFTGSTATKNGGSMSMFTTRNYNYDSSLLYLQPPWFPTVEDAYTVVMSRELAP
jgi:hypothetical protein